MPVRRPAAPWPPPAPPPPRPESPPRTLRHCRCPAAALLSPRRARLQAICRSSRHAIRAQRDEKSSVPCYTRGSLWQGVAGQLLIAIERRVEPVVADPALHLASRLAQRARRGADVAVVRTQDRDQLIPPLGPAALHRLAGSMGCGHE